MGTGKTAQSVDVWLFSICAFHLPCGVSGPGCGDLLKGACTL